MIFGPNCSWCGFPTRTQSSGQNAGAIASAFDAFREILRPKEGLRMTVGAEFRFYFTRSPDGPITRFFSVSCHPRQL